MADANFSFLARQLMLTELHGEASETPGGVYVTDNGALHLGLWDLQAAGDPEQVIRRAQAAAHQSNAELQGAVLLLPQGDAAGEPATALSEALYVYGYPPATGHDSVMILGTAAHPKPDPELRLAGLETADLPETAPASLAELLGPAANAATRAPELRGAWRGEALVAAVGTSAAGLVERVTLLHGDDKPALLTLLEGVAASAGQAGRLIVCAWVSRRGMLRFTLAEAGYAEQVQALHFTRQD